MAVIIEGNKLSHLSSNLEVGCVLLHANVHGKGMNAFFLPPSSRADRILITLVWQPVLEKKNIGSKPAEFCIKIDHEPRPGHGSGLAWFICLIVYHHLMGYLMLEFHSFVKKLIVMITIFLMFYCISKIVLLFVYCNLFPVL